MQTDPFFINLAHGVYVVDSKEAAIEAYNSMWKGREGIELEAFELMTTPCLVVFDDAGHIEIIDTSTIEYAMTMVQNHKSQRNKESN